MKLKIISLILAVVFVCGMMPMVVVADESAGSTVLAEGVMDETNNPGVTWKIIESADKSDVQLLISGLGPVSKLASYGTNQESKDSDTTSGWKMGDYTVPGVDKPMQYSPTPWMEYSNKITSIKVEEGINAIAYAAFAYLRYVTDVSLPSTLQYMGCEVFKECLSLESIVLPEGLIAVNQRTFQNCKALKYVYVPSTFDMLNAWWGSGQFELGHNVANGMFQGCENLKYVYYNTDIPQAYKGESACTVATAFDEASAKNCTLIIKAGTYSETVYGANGTATIKPATVLTTAGTAPVSISKSDDRPVAPGTAFDIKLTLGQAKNQDAVRVTLDLGDKFTYISNEPTSEITAAVISNADGKLVLDYTVGRTNTLSNAEIGTITLIPTDALTTAGVIGITSCGVHMLGEDRVTGYVTKGESLTVSAGEVTIPPPDETLEKSGNVTPDGSVKWEVVINDDADVSYTLTLSGEGAVASVDNYTVDNATSEYVPALDEKTGKILVATPWKDYAYFINNVVIEEGITAIAAYAFAYLPKLTDVSIPSTVRYIGTEAFANNEALKNVNIENGVNAVNKGVFKNCTALEFIRIPDTLDILIAEDGAGDITRHSVATDMFAGCTALKYVYLPITAKPDKNTVKCSAPFAGIESTVTIICAETSYAKIYAEAVDEEYHNKTVAIACMDVANLAPVKLTTNIDGKATPGSEFKLTVKLVSAKKQEKVFIEFRYDSSLVEYVSFSDHANLGASIFDQEEGFLMIELNTGVDNTIDNVDVLEFTMKVKADAEKTSTIKATSYGMFTVDGQILEGAKKSEQAVISVARESVTQQPTDVTNAPTTEKNETEEKGCSSNMGIYGIALVTVILFGSALLTRKSYKET